MRTVKRYKNLSIMTKSNMARILLAVLLAAVLPATRALAQDDLGINKIFERYGHARGCTLVELHDIKIQQHRLKKYKSIVYTRIGSEVKAALREDRRRAKKIREIVDNGRIVSGYYMMPQQKEGINRYVLFSDTDGRRGAVIYIEGRLSPDDIMDITFVR